MSIREESITTLNRAYECALKTTNPICNHKEFIDFVIENTHLTYKYVLFTAILSKATNESINPLCLQKKSTLPGAYDARTVCHKVIVPFEMEKLNKVLGGSNEPFLNKPARFTELNKNNAVRKGNDQAILNSLCENLPTIKTSKDAYECLIYLLNKLIKMRDNKNKELVFTIEDSANLPYRLMHYINESLSNSFEGEVLTLMVAGIYNLLYLDNPQITVEVHPVNQSGASGREVSDLDIYYEKQLIVSNELKDKSYSETDVRHAADKVIASGGTRMLFIEGPHATPNKDFKSAVEKKYASHNFQLSIVSYEEFFSTLVNIIPRIDCQSFIHFIINSAMNTKFKQPVIEYLDTLAQEILGLKR